MEVYILDDLLRREQVVDDFVSLIWAERLNTYGDFELVLNASAANRQRFSAGTQLAMNESYRVMTVETVVDSTDDDGKMLLDVKGRSLEATTLDNRLARAALSDLTTTPKWVLTGLPVAIAQNIFHTICVTAALDAGDHIPFVVEASLFPPDTIPVPTDSITYEVEPKSVYTALSELCGLYNMGFRFSRNFDASQLYFDIYTGSDRTTAQTVLPAVVFSPGLDNLQNTTNLTSIAAYKNVAYVISPVGHQVVYAPDVDPSISGFARNVLYVDASDITDTNPTVAANKMIQRGVQELAKCRPINAFDGEINQNSAYIYGRDYNLGDIAELRNDTGTTTIVQVTEQLFVSDASGERSYPALTLNETITPGSWGAWDFNEVWNDVPTTVHWADL